MNSQPGGLKGELHELGDKLLDLLFPPRCVNCAKPGSALCPACLASIPLVPPPYCSRCGQVRALTGATCARCRAQPPVISRVLFATWHQDTAQNAIHELKYKRRRDVARPLAELLTLRLRQANVRFDVLSCVPLHPTREYARGYNQAELLSRETARQLNAPFAHTLERTRATADQIGLDAAARRHNVQDAFRAAPSLDGAKNVILVDDVCTTGATLDACAQALFEAGVQRVIGLTVARPRLD